MSSLNVDSHWGTAPEPCWGLLFPRTSYCPSHRSPVTALVGCIVNQNGSSDQCLSSLMIGSSMYSCTRVVSVYFGKVVYCFIAAFKVFFGFPPVIFLSVFW